MLLRTVIFIVVALSAAGQQAPVAASVGRAPPPINPFNGTRPSSPGPKARRRRITACFWARPRGSGRDGDSSLITGLQGQFAGLPAGQNLYVTLWSYDQNANPVQPPSSCSIKTAPQQSSVAFKDVPNTALAGVSLGSVAVQAAESCQAQCKQNAGCQGYTFYPAGPANPAAMCDLKSQITDSRSDPCCLSGLKTVAQAVAPAPPPPPPPPPTPVAAPTPAAAKVRAPAPAPPPPQASVRASAPSTGLITGDWVNQAGAISRIVQRGNSITGVYADPKLPSLSGTLQGTFDGTTLRATLKWKSGSDSSYGSLELTLTPQGRLEGTWTDAKGVSGPWSMGSAGAAR